MANPRSCLAARLRLWRGGVLASDGSDHDHTPRRGHLVRVQSGASPRVGLGRLWSLRLQPSSVRESRPRGHLEPIRMPRIARGRSSAGARSTHSGSCYDLGMSDRGELLRQVMAETGTRQGELSRLSGVHQPSISQFLSGRVDLSDEQLDRLLSCMGRRLKVVRDVIEPVLTRSERRSWLLHRKISSQLTPDMLGVWEPTIVGNVRRLRGGVTGQPHTRNLERWQHLVSSGDILGLKRVLTGQDRESIEMREVSPMRGVLTEQDRLDVLARVS